ncbi:hypothetical protein [Pseudomonas sp. C2B4]|uniref:hypothetical protein n=1 Tax=Pseudomonas sp. C2B4 TaxID=2735270 RepID=UPI001586F32C|nr:hypothetical protein [Pseudomonas sp. C2B4]NUU38565.1 hypothetical protein [Pseudomonas sp. C2B4]
MHIAIRAAGFSLMTMFVSCGVGAQDLDTGPAYTAVQPTPAGGTGHWKMPLPTPVNQHNR